MRSRISRSVSSRGLVVSAGLGAVFIAPASQAQTLSWLNAAGGAASTAANWNPAQIPGASSPLVWNLANTYTVTFSGAVPQSTSHTYKRGIVTLSMTSSHTTSSFVRVGDVSGDSATATLTSGTLRAGSGLTIGNASGATGSLTIDNEGSLIDTVNAGSDFVVGSAGTGTLIIRDGASAVPADDLIVGSAATGVGTVTVTGTGGLPLPVPSSLLNLSGSGKDITVGSVGDGFFNVLSGGAVNTDEMFVGLNVGSNGSVTVGGIGGILNAHSQINIATSLHLGNNPSVGINGGSSSFTVNDDGIVTVLGTTFIGDPTNNIGSGTLTLNQGGVFTTGSLIATDSGGFLNHFGGHLRINGGSLQVRNDVLTLDGGTGRSPVLILENGAACTLASPGAPTEALIVGNTSSATFDVFTGSHLTVFAGDVVLGNLAGSNGDFQVTGTGSTATLSATGVLVVGDAGEGVLTIQSGGHLTSGTVNLGRTATGQGTASVNNLGASWDITGSLNIGGTDAAAFGTGTLSIGVAGNNVNDGTVNVNSAGLSQVSVRVWSPGDSLTIGDGGTLNCDEDVVVDGVFTLSGGTVSAQHLELRSSVSPYSLAGTIRAILSAPGIFVETDLTGDLDIGPGPVSTGGVLNLGTIEIGDHSLAFTTPTFPPGTDRIGNCHIGALGTLSSIDSLEVNSSKTLSGDGTVDAPINNSGFIVSQGSGLTFTKIFTGIGQGISGTTITFGNGGGFTGSGALSNSTPITMLTGSTINATGDLSMGSSASAAGFNGNFGRIVITGDFDVTLNDSAQAIIPSIEFPDSSSGSPSVRCNSGLGVVGTVTGTGTLVTSADSIIAISGTLRPGNSSSEGTISLEGDTRLNTNTLIVLDVFNATTSDKIKTAVAIGPIPPFFFQSDMTLGGTLILQVSSSHTPTNGEAHTLIECSGAAPSAGRLLGSFSSIIAPPHWIISERTTNSGLGPDQLVAVYCTADFNNDGFVDGFDYDDFVACFEGSPCPPGEDADFNNDGFPDGFDYDDFVTAFENGC